MRAMPTIHRPSGLNTGPGPAWPGDSVPGAAFTRHCQKMRIFPPNRTAARLVRHSPGDQGGALTARAALHDTRSTQRPGSGRVPLCCLRPSPACSRIAAMKDQQVRPQHHNDQTSLPDRPATHVPVPRPGAPAAGGSPGDQRSRAAVPGRRDPRPLTHPVFPGHLRPGTARSPDTNSAKRLGPIGI